MSDGYKRTSCVLRGVGNDGGTVRFVLAGDRALVGRLGDINLDHDSVSRRHALLERRDDDWILIDLDSTNGTFVNSATIQRHRLSDGDVICFGRVSLKFEVVETETSPDAPTGAITRTELATVRERMLFSSMVGRSEAIRKAMHQASRAAKSKATVLVLGESGTGKELFSRFIYSESDRRAAKFLAVNCGAIAPTLQDATLFGHEKGAFTGADRLRKGLFEEANGGTLFLDEVGELTLDAQTKLLRVLQEGEIMRLGSMETIKVDVRLVCATNRDLARLVEDGKFRKDLFYRLNVIKIMLPPLRDRREDIPDLANHFAAKFGGVAAKQFAPGAMAAMLAYDWPGNIRELQNVVESASVMGVGAMIELGDLPPELVAAHKAISTTCVIDADGQMVPSSAMTDEELPSLEKIELLHVLSTVKSVGGNKKLAAQKLSISRSTLYEKLARAERLGLTPTSQNVRKGSGAKAKGVGDGTL